MSDRKETTYCCVQMARWSQPDGLIHHTAVVHMPGIRIFDGGSAFVVISFCPWCGTQVFDNSGLEGHRVKEGAINA